MAFSLVFTLLALSAVSLAVEVPVYMFGDIAKSSLKYSPLNTVQKEEFSDILKEELVKDPFTVIFIEETLSVEDLSLKNEDGESAFPFLRAHVRDSAYLPSVENAIQALNYLADPEKVDHVKLTENGLSAEIEPQSTKFLFINLKDAKEGETRADLLRRHNDFMEEMFSKLQQRYNKVAAIYTARFPSWVVPEAHSRARREAASKQAVAGSHYNLTGILMDVGQIQLAIEKSTLNLVNGNASNTVEENNMTTILEFDQYNLSFFFKKVAGYWIMNSVTVSNETISETVQPDRDVSSLLGFSYRCAPDVTLSGYNQSINVRVTLKDLKLQVYFGGENETRVFGDSLNCVGFFTAPIWASLFVTFTLLAITLYGLMMIMDIRTNDRFDDAKGKTITINATD